MSKMLPIERKKRGKTFQYFLDGQKITDKNELKRLERLKIPPAWKEVRVSTSRRAKIQATGIDKAGRIQYIYSDSFRQQQEKAKFDRILRFARALPKMRRTTERHLRHRRLDRNKVMAAIIQIMDQTYLRIGNDTYAQQNNSYGLTTLRSKHTLIEGDTIIFDFTGKSGKHHQLKISHPRLAEIVKKLDNLPGYEVFKYYDQNGELKDVKSDDVNAYIRQIMGDEFSAKDFRTWGGTLLATAELAAVKQTATKKERKRAVSGCVKQVAKKLGNTPAVARSSYIDPRIIDSFIYKNNLQQIRRTVEKIDDKYASPEEHCVLKLLEQN